MDIEKIFLDLYRNGKFPMADDKDAGKTYIFDPPERTLIPLNLHVPRSLQKTIKKGGYEIRFDTAFRDVITACRDRRDTWINETILEAFVMLHDAGHTHSVEYWQNNELKGGLYGLSMGAIFCGESMFSLAPNASKICLVALCNHLKQKNFKLLDAQFMNDHLKQFGAYTIPREEYLGLLIQNRDAPIHFS